MKYNMQYGHELNIKYDWRKIGFGFKYDLTYG